MAKYIAMVFLFDCFLFFRLGIARGQDPATIHAAKNEGEVSYYTGKNLATMRKVASAFENKYPFLTVKITRTFGEQIPSRHPESVPAANGCTNKSIPM